MQNKRLETIQFIDLESDFWWNSTLEREEMNSTLSRPFIENYRSLYVLGIVLQCREVHNQRNAKRETSDLKDTDISKCARNCYIY